MKPNCIHTKIRDPVFGDCVRRGEGEKGRGEERKRGGEGRGEQEEDEGRSVVKDESSGVCGG